MKKALIYIKNYPSKVVNNDLTMGECLFTVSLIVAFSFLFIHAMGGVHYGM